MFLPENTDAPQQGSPPPGYFLEVSHLSKTYREGTRSHVVLKDVCYRQEKGKITAILGKSGSGKTTLLNLISGIDQADTGRVFFEGADLTGLNDHGRTMVRRKRMGFIFQFFNLIPTLTVWENVNLPVELNGFTSSQCKERVEAMLGEVGLLDRCKAYPEQLSGGEQQRVSIARALVHDPDLLLADEPTGNLDEETGKDILALLDRLTQQNGKSLLMVTHSQAAAAIADRRVYLFDGCLTESENGNKPPL